MKICGSHRVLYLKETVVLACETNLCDYITVFWAMELLKVNKWNGTLRFLNLVEIGTIGDGADVV